MTLVCARCRMAVLSTDVICPYCKMKLDLTLAAVVHNFRSVAADILLASGKVDPLVMGTGTPDGASYLQGDGLWVVGPLKVQLKNATGSPTVLGKIYALSKTEPAAVSNLSPAPGSYLASVADRFYICMGGGVADEDPDIFIAIGTGAEVEVYVDAATAIGDWIVLKDTAGQGSPLAAPVVGSTIGVAVAATVGAGLVLVRLAEVWA